MISIFFYILITLLFLGWGSIYLLNYQSDRHIKHSAQRVKKFISENQSKQDIKNNFKDKVFQVFINPVGGTKKGIEILETILKPLANFFKIKLRILITQYQNHAFEEIQTLDFDDIFGIIVIGGDGFFGEIIRGVSSKFPNDPKKIENFFSNHPVGLICGGSSNGFCTSLGARDPFQACINIFQGELKKVDLNQVFLYDTSYENGQIPRIFYEVAHTSWGLMSYQDLLQERKLRWMQTDIRNVLAPLWALLKLSSLSGTIYFEVVETKKEEKYSNYENFEKVKCPLEDEKDSGMWRKMETDFVSGTCANIPDGAYDIKFSPSVKLDEGSFDFITARKHPKFTRTTAIWVFLTGLEDGSYVYHELIDFFKVKKVVWEPKKGNNAPAVDLTTLSGELYPANIRTVVISHPRLLTCIY